MKRHSANAISKRAIIATYAVALALIIIVSVSLFASGDSFSQQSELGSIQKTTPSQTKAKAKSTPSVTPQTTPTAPASGTAREETPQKPPVVSSTANRATQPTPAPAPTPTLELRRVSTRGFYFATINFSSNSYLWVLEPTRTNRPQTSMSGSNGFSAISPGIGEYPHQTGSVTLADSPLGIETGDTFSFYVCANVNGACGLRSNSITGTVVFDGFPTIAF